jgi:hypothetical protein
LEGELGQKHKALSEKQTTRAGDMAQVAECLPMGKALSPIPRTAKNKYIDINSLHCEKGEKYGNC